MLEMFDLGSLMEAHTSEVDSTTWHDLLRSVIGAMSFVFAFRSPRSFLGLCRRMMEGQVLDSYPVYRNSSANVFARTRTGPV